MTIQIPLRNRQGIVIAQATIDDDFPYVGQRWSVANTGYAQGFVAKRVVHMHRVVMGLQSGNRLIVDHIVRAVAARWGSLMSPPGCTTD